jgi:hypothetical protein
MKRSPRVIAAAVTLGVSALAAREAAGSEEEAAETKNEIGVFVGGISNLDTDETGPSVGFDHTREISERFGIGALAEWANAGEREAMFAATVDWKPGAGIKLVAAPGIVVEKEEDDSRPRYSPSVRDSHGCSRSITSL